MPEPVPMLDLARQHAGLEGALGAAVGRVVASGVFIGGPEVEGFEAELAAWHGAAHALGVANGTDALLIALKALGIGPGDEVITTALSFFATAEAISLAGARPVFCDIDPATANLDPAGLARLLTPRTRAVIPVHLYGQPADMDAVTAFARAHGLAVIEDCAQAIGATWRGRKVGTFGDLACFSFYPSKNLGAFGDAGAILTGDAGLAERCRVLANHGGARRYEHRVVGMNSRLDALQAAVLRVKLARLDTWTAARGEVARLYRERLKGLPLELPARAAEAGHAWHLFVIRVRERDRVVAGLRRAGIMADIHYPEPLPFVPAYAGLGLDRATYPNACAHAAQCLSLPLFLGLREDEIDRVVTALAACLDR